MRRRRIALLAGGAVLVVLGGLWLARKPIAGAAMQDACKKQGLACEFALERLNFGGVTLKDLSLKAPDGGEDLVSAGRLAVDLSWSSPFSARAAWVGGDKIVVRLDATGKGPLLGDLQSVLDNLPEQDPNRPRAPTPRVSLRNIELITDTMMGPIRATGQVLTGDGGKLDLRLAAEPARLTQAGSELVLNAAELRATSDGQELKGRIVVDLPTYRGDGAKLQDVKLDFELEQDFSALLAGSGVDAQTTRAPKPAPKADLQAELQAGPVTMAAFPAPEWLAGLKKLSGVAVAGAGSIGDLAWAGGEVKADISATTPGAPGGEISAVARDVALPMGDVDRLELKGQVALPPGSATAQGRRLTAEGTARLSGGSLAPKARAEFGEAMRRPLQGALPRFASALADSAMRAGERFDLVLPWSFRMDDGGFDASALSGAEFTAASGLQAKLSGPGGSAAVWSSRKGASTWKAAGELATSGGGAPGLNLVLEEAHGSGSNLSARGRAEMKPWTVGGDSVAAVLDRAEFANQGGAGKASLSGLVSFGGDLGGVIWTNGRAVGEVDADWTPLTFLARADKGLSIEWDKLVASETELGAGALRYTANGPLAERKGLVVVGSGQLAAIDAPVSGQAFTGRFNSAPLSVSWSAGRAVTGQVKGGPIKLDLQQSNRVTPIQIAELTGALRLDRTWRLSGSFAGGSIVGETAAADGAGGQFSISGGRQGVDGVVEKVRLRLFDPTPEQDKRRFEPVRFEGGAKINAGVADFTGELKLGQTGMVLMAVNGKHDLGTGTGGANFNGRLRFSPAFFQPYRLSPLFRGPANVTGALTLGGRADWDGKTASAKGTAELDKLGFALANAGIFEGVSGKVEIADLFNMKSDPGQTITLQKVTLGAPFENGEIKFQLAGYDGIKLESARWPFAGGEIRVRPSDVRFAMEGTHVVAEAFGWDLEKVVEIFKVPDLKVKGRVNGRFPITFTTGSARIDKAVLLASEDGGVLAYTGNTGAAAGKADPSAKMLFDALKDFRFKVLELELDGDLAGDMDLKLKLQGNNPQVLSGGEFHINIGIDAPLMSLLNMQNNVNSAVRSVVNEISGGAN